MRRQAAVFASDAIFLRYDRRRGSSPTRLICRSAWSTASNAPEISSSGPWSPPMASRAIRTALSYSASAARLKTVRPLYFPQLPQRRCGSFGSPHSEQRDRPGAFSASCERLLWVRECECLLFGRAIVSSSNEKDADLSVSFSMIFQFF